MAPKVETALNALPALIDSAITAHADRIAIFAEAMKREPVIYTMGAGANYATAYSYAICIFQEMQWIHSAGIHAGDEFPCLGTHPEVIPRKVILDDIPALPAEHLPPRFHAAPQPQLQCRHAVP